MSTPQRRYEHAIDARMDAAQEHCAHAFCECGANMDDETGDKCEKCMEKEIEEND